MYLWYVSYAGVVHNSGWMRKRLYETYKTYEARATSHADILPGDVIG